LKYKRLQALRSWLQRREEGFSPFAAKENSSQGRQRPEEPSPVRLEYQRDRDRIIHCNSFRRLKHKTQVFIAPVGDHYVTRLTHTLEVSQIARTISRALNLNEDLTEAIALGHDLGHTPFGHTGEEVLNELYPPGFHHSEQSLRVVDILENRGRGLNLTWEVRDGILNHSKTRVIDIMGPGWGEGGTWEGDVCKISDVIAYINHDIDDALRARTIAARDLPSDAIHLLGRTRAQRINRLVCDIIENSWSLRGEDGSQSPALRMSEEVRGAARELHEFLYRRVYNISSAQPEAVQAREVVRALWEYFISHPTRLPREYHADQNGVERIVVDYIAGMTDYFALNQARELGLLPG
jgi:dGTPase